MVEILEAEMITAIILLNILLLSTPLLALLWLLKSDFGEK